MQITSLNIIYCFKFFYQIKIILWIRSDQILWIYQWCRSFKYSISFPKDLERRKAWIDNMRIENWEPTTNERICSRHFEDKWFYKTDTQSKVRLLNQAVPTIFPELPKYLQPCVVNIT